jgi:thioester reductase-like protein
VRYVLLSGATGFFGAFVLAELLARTDAQIHCLVRAADEAAARRRLWSVLDGYGLVLSVDRERIRVVPGDLSRPDLGIAGARYAWLARRMDVILHLAAEVNALLPADRLRAANVDGTERILALAATVRPKPVFVASTMSVLASGPLSGYAHSKLLAERIVRDVQRAGVPATIVRLPRLSAATATGRFNPDDLMQRVVGVILRSRLAPDIEVEDDWIPVDLAARTFVGTALTGRTAASLAFRATTRFSLRECLRTAAELDLPVETLPLAEWAPAIRRIGGLDGELAASVLDSRSSGARRPPGAGTEGFETVQVPGMDRTTLRRWLARTLAAPPYSPAAGGTVIDAH